MTYQAERSPFRAMSWIDELRVHEADEVRAGVAEEDAPARVIPEQEAAERAHHDERFG